MALVYREYHAGRPATTMETVMDSKLAKEAGESVVFHHIADLGDTGLLNLHDISIKRSLGGQGRVVRGGASCHLANRNGIPIRRAELRTRVL